METAHENLDPKQSLDIIANMIHEAKGNVRNNGIHFLLWGWVVAIGNVGMFTLIQLEYPSPHLIWLITIPAAFLSAYFAGATSPKK